MAWDDSYNNDLHQYAGAIVAEISVFICFLESYQRIQNSHLKVSITTFIVCSVLVNCCYLTGTAFVASGNIAAAIPIYVTGSICWVLAWLSVTYHTSYRAALISLIGYQRPWLISLICVLCQGALSGTGSVFFTINFVNNLGTKVDPRSTTITFVESFWYSIVETVLFVITQYRIVSVRSRIKKVGVSVQVQLYGKAVTRSLLYSLNVIMMFLSVGNTFGAGVGGNWSTYGHAMTLLILMTDSNRFQETIAALNGDRAPRFTGMDTKTYGSQIGDSLGENSLSDHKHQPKYPPGNNHARSNSTKFSEAASGLPIASGQYGGDYQTSGNGVFGTGGAAGQLYNNNASKTNVADYNSGGMQYSGYGGANASHDKQPGVTFGFPQQSQATRSNNYPPSNYQPANAAGPYGGSAYGGSQYGGSQVGNQHSSGARRQ